MPITIDGAGAATSARMPASLPCAGGRASTSFGHFRPGSTALAAPTASITANPAIRGIHPHARLGMPSALTPTDMVTCVPGTADQLRPLRPRPAV